MDGTSTGALGLNNYIFQPVSKQLTDNTEAGILTSRKSTELKKADTKTTSIQKSRGILRA